ncbi:Serine/threonine-protein kinase TOUSLED [Hordeum vulgare]|nr:Serine/threonine-protein kinase TOUSLED [Hordeum vulgare]
MSAAGEDIVQHLSSNSNPSSSKLAKLEARMAGKAVSVLPPSSPHHPWSPPPPPPPSWSRRSCLSSPPLR